MEPSFLTLFVHSFARKHFVPLINEYRFVSKVIWRITSAARPPPPPHSQPSTEGLNGVNRQPSNGHKVNRQPAKTEYFTVNRRQNFFLHGLGFFICFMI